MPWLTLPLPWPEEALQCRSRIQSTQGLKWKCAVAQVDAGHPEEDESKCVNACMTLMVECGYYWFGQCSPSHKHLFLASASFVFNFTFHIIALIK